MTTTLILRAIAEVARRHREDLSRFDTRMECVAGLGLSGGRRSDGPDVGYLAARATLARFVADACGALIERGAGPAAVTLFGADEVAHDHFFLRSTVQEMTTIVADLAATTVVGAFTAAEFRDWVDNGRKVAIQILEFFDRHGVTLRRGDLRRVNPHRLDLFGTDGSG